MRCRLVATPFLSKHFSSINALHQRQLPSQRRHQQNEPAAQRWEDGTHTFSCDAARDALRRCTWAANPSAAVIAAAVRSWSCGALSTAAPSW